MGLIDKFPIGAAFGKGLTLKMGQTHVHKYLGPLLERIERGEIDPSFVITHRFRLEDAVEGASIFHASARGSRCGWAHRRRALRCSLDAWARPL